MRVALVARSRLFKFRKWYSSDPKIARSEIDAALDDAAKVLPIQAILENFLHQNPLQAFESLPFKEAIEHVHHLESYMSPAGEKSSPQFDGFFFVLTGDSAQSECQSCLAWTRESVPTKHSPI